MYNVNAEPLQDTVFFYFYLPKISHLHYCRQSFNSQQIFLDFPQLASFDEKQFSSLLADNFKHQFVPASFNLKRARRYLFSTYTMSIKSVMGYMCKSKNTSKVRAAIKSLSGLRVMSTFGRLTSIRKLSHNWNSLKRGNMSSCHGLLRRDTSLCKVWSSVDSQKTVNELMPLIARRK